MKKASVVALFVIMLVSSAFAARMFDYRGVFSADRAADAKITNYILLKKASVVNFAIEEPGKGLAERVKVTRVKLTSDEKVVFENLEGLKELLLPVTGIYEVTLVPVSQTSGEIRFVLKVLENEAQIQEQLPIVEKTANKNEPAQPAQPIKPVKPAKPTQAVQPEQPASKELVSPDVPKAVVVASETPVIVPAVVAPVVSLSNATEVASGVAVAITTDGSIPTLVAPQNGVFVNPFNGFRFSAEDINLLPQDKQRQMIRVFLKNAVGSETVVPGSFFSPEPDILVFLPEKIIPAAVYNIEMTDEMLAMKKLALVPAFPDLKTEFAVAADELKVKIFWHQIIDLLPGPQGQVLALNGTQINLGKGDEQILQLDIDNNLLPFGAIDRISYRAQPCEFELSVPLDMLAGADCTIEIKAAVDGSPGKVQARKAVWKNSVAAPDDTTGQNDESDDFSEETAIADTEVRAPEKIELLESLPASSSFVLERSFSVLEIASDSLISWPQDVAWDNYGGLWILDSQKRRVCNFYSDGVLRLAFGNKGDDAGSLGLPVAIANNADTIFISDISQHCIHLFGEDGVYKNTIKSDPVNGSMIDLPGGLCFRKDEIWVADRGIARILCFNTGGGFLGSFGSTPTAPILAPVAVRADADSLYILEKNGLVKKFSPMGQFDATFQTGCAEGLGFDVDNWGGIWVCDAEKFQVLRFAKNGSLLTTLKAPPAPKPWLPTSVSVRKDGKVAVTDAQNKMLHIFVPNGQTAQ